MVSLVVAVHFLFFILFCVGCSCTRSAVLSCFTLVEAVHFLFFILFALVVAVHFLFFILFYVSCSCTRSAVLSCFTLVVAVHFLIKGSCKTWGSDKVRIVLCKFICYRTRLVVS